VTYTPELDAAVCATAARAYRPHGVLSFDEVRQIGRLAALEIVGRADATVFVTKRVEWRVRDAYRRAKVWPYALDPSTMTRVRDSQRQERDVAEVYELRSRLQAELDRRAA
jgi:hypothetical protein